MSSLSPADERLLERTANALFKRMKPGGDPGHLPWPQRVFVTIYAVQPIIDNGGFQYLFESDWPGCPPYGDFAAAYREIGADEVAGWLEEAVALFPFPEPHRQREARVKYLRAYCVEGDSPMGLLSDRAIDASDAVFARLAAYVRNRPDDFRRTWRDWLPRLGGG